jgi:hypothetical protein
MYVCTYALYRINQRLDKPGQIVHSVVIGVHSTGLDKRGLKEQDNPMSDKRGFEINQCLIIKI